MSKIFKTLIPWLDMCSWKIQVSQSINLSKGKQFNKQNFSDFKFVINKLGKQFTTFSLRSLNTTQTMILDNGNNLSGTINAGVGIGNNDTLSITVNVNISIENNTFIFNIDEQNSYLTVTRKYDRRSLSQIPKQINNISGINWI